MTVELTLKECDVIEDALASLEVQHERRAEVDRRLSNDSGAESELSMAKFLKELRTRLMKSRVAATNTPVSS